MKVNIQEKTLNAILIGLQPIVKALVSIGIGYREFDALVKRAFVRVASREFGKRGRLANISRIATVTGLSRKEIKRLREAEESNGPAEIFEVSPLGWILSQWYANPDYTDADDKPRALPIQSDTETSFTDLAKTCAFDVPVSALLNELRQTKAIAELPDGRLLPTRMSYIPDNLNDIMLLSVETGLYPLGATIAHNNDPSNKEARRYQRFASADGIDLEHFPEIREMLNEEVTEFMRKINKKLAKYEMPGRVSKNTPRSQIGLGAYYFETDSAPDF